MSSESFKALIVETSKESHSARVGDFSASDLHEGDVDVSVSRSCVNYKDALAITGRGRIARVSPLIPGVDFVGEVLSSSDSRYSEGDVVLMGGWGAGETHHGGLAERARVKGDWLIPLPDGLSADSAIALGTAGFTAMLCVEALERHGVSPDGGDVLVTGAAGGVGSVAVALLARNGYRVVASTGRVSEEAFLRDLGASEVIDRAEFAVDPKPLASSRWAGAVDVAGSKTLANILSQMKYGGAVAACGLAHGMDLPSSVAPFILRNVALLGVDSAQTPRERRLASWDRLSREIDRSLLDEIASHAPLDEAIAAAESLLDGGVRGRMIIDVR